MTSGLPIHGMLGVVALSMIGACGALAAETPRDEIGGKALLEKNCSRCHSIEVSGESPLAGAPPLREVYLKYPLEQLEYGFAEGMGSKHRDMPQIPFSTEEVAAILDYLGSITGVPPSQRPASGMPDEIEPP